MAPPGLVIPIAVALSLVLVFHHPCAAASDFLSPLLAPIFENVCKGVPCGRGSCRPTENSFIPFQCVCDPGWKQPFSADGFEFLPCVFPNCTINYSCSPSASPPPSPAPISARATNQSFFDVCSWNNFCGGGTCNRSSSSNSSSYSYSCSCSEGYANLMNSSSFPCFRDCGLGGDCHNLGLTLFNQTARTPATSTVENTTNNVRSLQYNWFILVLVMFATTILFT